MKLNKYYQYCVDAKNNTLFITRKVFALKEIELKKSFWTSKINKKVKNKV